MAIKDVFKISRKTFFNPRAWLGYDTLKESTQGFLGIMRSVFGQRLASSGQPETFQQAVERYQLAEKDIKSLQVTYFSYAVFFFLMALAALAYSVWLFLHFYFYAFFIGLAVVVLLVGQAFRFHFWYFQIKHRKLGCTFQEWRSGQIQNKEAE